MVSYLEVYMLKCNACGKKKKVQRLPVHGNLAEIERTWICPDCRRAGRKPGDEAERAGSGEAATV